MVAWCLEVPAPILLATGKVFSGKVPCFLFQHGDRERHHAAFHGSLRHGSGIGRNPPPPSRLGSGRSAFSRRSSSRQCHMSVSREAACRATPCCHAWHNGGGLGEWWQPPTTPLHTPPEKPGEVLSREGVWAPPWGAPCR